MRGKTSMIALWIIYASDIASERCIPKWIFEGKSGYNSAVLSKL
jgi:hypothetical protein